MATNGTNANGSQLLVVGDTGGVTVVDRSTPLTRLNYFDGKFLRASDFNVEQSYLRQLVAISNQGLSAGVVYGYDTTLGSGDTIQIGPGLAIDPSGKVLLMQATVTQSIQALIDASRKSAPALPDASGKTGAGVFNDCVEIAAPPPTTVIAVSDIYVIAICAAEALCGQADVYGKLCEEACVTSTDRPFRLDGIVIRAIPLQLVTPFPTSKAVAIDSNLYLRSKVAHSWYADEELKHPSAISRAGLLSTVWCLGAGYDSSCCEVPLAVVARAGATTIFLDAWTVRRERIDAPARRYWQWKMMMRPWNVFLAQILQFQCQLADVLSGAFVPGNRNVNPCANEHQTLGEAAKLIEEVRTGLMGDGNAMEGATPSGQPALIARIVELRGKIANVLSTAATPSQLTDRILIGGGIIELPPAGYLPVMNGTSVSVNDQVRALLGDGLDLRFCATTADYVAHALEEAQHMDRISLIQGLDDPSNKPRVDILVPDGKIIQAAAATDPKLYDSALIGEDRFTDLKVDGTSREESLGSGGNALYSAGFGGGGRLVEILIEMAAYQNQKGRAAIRAAFAGQQQLPEVGLWLMARNEQSIKQLRAPQQTQVSGRLAAASPTTATGFDISFSGALVVDQVMPPSGGDPLTISGSINLMMGIMPISEQAKPTANWVGLKIVLSYVGDDSKGTITVDVFDPNPNNKNPSRPVLRVTRTYSGAPSAVSYELFNTSSSGDMPPSTVFTKMATLSLTPDSGVLDQNNKNRKLAETGLDTLSKALHTREPSFKATAESELYPAIPRATNALTIQAVRDWVMFTRRREEQCALEVVPPPPEPQVATPEINDLGTGPGPTDAAVVYVEVKVADPLDAQIYYTTDGSDPSADSPSSTLFGANHDNIPILVSDLPVTVKAIAVQPGYRDSQIASQVIPKT
jgi:hypothetical protein